MAQRRSEIAAALPHQTRPSARNRLLALDAVLAGQSIDRAARIAKRAPSTLRDHLRELLQGGVAVVLPASRSRIDLSLLRVSKDDIKAALGAERHPRIRRRLAAILAILEGASIPLAARRAKASTASLVLWLRLLRQTGLQALLHDCKPGRPLKPPAPDFNPDQVRAAIAAALRRHPPWRVQLRLRAIDAYLAGDAPSAAAAIASVKHVTLEGWLRQLRTRGAAATLAAWEAPRKYRRAELHADAARLRSLAQTHPDRWLQHRFLGLAFVADGMPVDDAAIQAGLSEASLRTAIRRFHREGYAIFSNRRKAGRQVKLTPGQLNTLRAIVRQNPNITPDDLRAHVLSEFGVRYSPSGLKSMLRKQLDLHPPRAALYGKRGSTKKTRR